MVKSEKFYKRVKHSEKEKLLITSNFSFFHSIFKRPAPGLVWERVKDIQKYNFEKHCGKGRKYLIPSFSAFSTIFLVFLPFQQGKLLFWSHVMLYQTTHFKDFAEDNLEFNDDGRKFSKRVENTVGKRLICPLQAISPFPRVFKRFLLKTCKN